MIANYCQYLYQSNLPRVAAIPRGCRPRPYTSHPYTHIYLAHKYPQKHV